MDRIFFKVPMSTFHQWRPVILLSKRQFNMKKLSLEKGKNPFLKKIIEQEEKRRETRGTFQRLVDKRTTEYKEYFSQSPEPSIIKRARHVSYDHVGQKRALHLSKILRAFVSERIGSGEIGDVLSSKNFQLTNIVVPVDLNRIEILWWSPEDEVPLIEELLSKAGEELKTSIRHAQLLPNLPPVIFRRDHAPDERDKINHLLDSADKGSSEAVEIEKPSERSDLYDTDRTVLLQKLSSQTVNEPDGDIDVEQMERRMRAFALTKRMKRLERQRSAIDGIVAIEKERESDEHFSLNHTNEK